MKERFSYKIDSILTYTNLDPEELALTTAIANWNNLGDWSKFLYTAHGRSIVVKSPTKNLVENEHTLFSGLQVIGAGGSLQALKEGISFQPDTIEVRRVSDIDCSKELSHLFQLRKIDQDGQLHFSQREYAPLGGMDKTEATNRRKYTSALFAITKKLPGKGFTLPFVVPEFAAEGFYVSKKDHMGNPLRYQVYRVPLIDRFPNQAVHTLQQKGINAALSQIGIASNLLGESLRIFHDANMAYMDGHIGNLSLLETPQKRPMLYMTDLGSIQQFSNLPSAQRYRGFDLYMYLESMSHLHSAFSTLAKALHLSDEHTDIGYYLSAAGSYLSGYFHLELLGQSTSEETYRAKLDQLTRKTLQAYLGTHHTAQQFIEFFENLYTVQTQ